MDIGKIVVLASFLGAGADAYAGNAGLGVGGGAVTVAGELVGAAGGGLLGVAIGGASCRSGAFECYAPLLGGAVGVGVGGIAGAFGGAALGAKLTGVRAGPVLGWTAAALGTGAAMMTLGALARADGLGTAGFLVATVGMPIAAGVSIGVLADARVAFVPSFGRDRRGVSLVVRF